MNTTEDAPSKYKQKVRTLAKYGNINGRFLLSSPAKTVLLLSILVKIFIYIYTEFKDRKEKYQRKRRK